MGTTIHRVIVVTSSIEKHLKAAHKKAVEVFAGEEWGTPYSSLISPIIHGITNGVATFMIAPNGSKEYWDTQENVQKCIDAFVGWLNACRYGDGSSPLDWFLAEYGETDKYGVEIVAQTDDISASDHYSGERGAEKDEPE